MAKMQALAMFVVEVFVFGREFQGLGVGVQGAGIIALAPQFDAQGVVGVDGLGIVLEDVREQLLEFVEAVLHGQDRRRLVQAGPVVVRVALALVGLGHAPEGLGEHGV